jgi:DNA-binding phage protein
MNKIPKMLRVIIEEKEKTSIRQIASNIGIDHGSLYRALRAGGNPEAKTIEKILDYFGYDIKFVKRKEVKARESRPSRSKRRS